ncbi:hypothetical protein B0H16DRAFT_1513486 [Mycena metata]|uniref:Uncharacterized protein n=1 Tax=Mycena metata TaxID=1033252 RepID=A0AAD7JXB7_9AGAR|nr:hypothetical protein B0H16DRAFT_1513486 [Mycena metata]
MDEQQCSRVIPSRPTFFSCCLWFLHLTYLFSLSFSSTAARTVVGVLWTTRALRTLPAQFSGHQCKPRDGSTSARYSPRGQAEDVPKHRDDAPLCRAGQVVPSYLVSAPQLFSRAHWGNHACARMSGCLPHPIVLRSLTAGSTQKNGLRTRGLRVWTRLGDP